MNNLFKHKYIRFLLITIVSFTIVFSSSVFSYADITTEPLAPTSFGTRYVASFLKASGMKFMTVTSALSASNDFYNSTTDLVRAFIDGKNEMTVDDYKELVDYENEGFFLRAIDDWIINKVGDGNSVDFISDSSSFDWSNYIHHEQYKSQDYSSFDSFLLTLNYLPINESFPLNTPIYCSSGDVRYIYFTFNGDSYSCYNSSDLVAFTNSVNTHFGITAYRSSSSYRLVVYDYDHNTYNDYGLTTSTLDSLTSIVPVTNDIESVSVDKSYLPSANGINALTEGSEVNVPVTLDEVVSSDIGVIRGEITETNNFLRNIFSKVSNLPTVIKSIFIPESFDFSAWLNGVFSPVAPNMDFNQYVSSVAIPDISANYKGSTMTFVDNSNLRDNIVEFRKYIKAFMGFLMLIFNINMFMKLMGYGGFTFNDHTPTQSTSLVVRGGK